MKKILTLLMLACFWTTTAHAEETIAVNGTGENQEVLRVLAKKFESLHPGVKVDVPDTIGSGGGIKALQKGKTDLARTGRPLKDTEKSGLVETMFGTSPAVFATHHGVKINNLTTAQILDIYSGKITNWKEVGGPDAKIYPTSREPGDSARSLLEISMPGFKELTFVSKEFFTSGDAVKGVMENENTIGYFSMAATSAAGLTPLKIDGKNPVPGADGKTDYPHMISFYLVSTDKPTPLVQQFIDFCLSDEARAILLANGTVPLK